MNKLIKTMWGFVGTPTSLLLMMIIVVIIEMITVYLSMILEAINKIKDK